MEKAERLQRLPPYLFVQIRNKIREARERGIDVISLGVGDPDQPTPHHVVQALCEAALDPANHQYPTDEEKGMLAFRQAVSRWYHRRFGVHCDPETEVLALIGSKEGNHHLSLAILNPGDVAVLPDPGYPAYYASAVFAGAEVVRVPIRREDGYLLRFDEIPREALARTRLIFLCYPNNPTGAVAPPEFYQQAVDFARAHDLVVVNDNPYSEICFDGYRDDLERLRQLYQRRRDLVLDTLRAIGLRPDTPKATFYICCPTPPGLRSIDYAADVLDKAGVVIT